MIQKQAAMCAILLTVSSAFCGTAFAAPLQGTEKAAVSAESALHVDSSRWNYDKDNDIYYQIGLVYCKNPVASEYESLSVYVPGEANCGVDFDPTNNLLPDTQHITLAWGRDFGDVSPLRGVILGGDTHKPEVAVTVMPYDEL